jgi:hypothetical protein
MFSLILDLHLHFAEKGDHSAERSEDVLSDGGKIKTCFFLSTSHPEDRRGGKEHDAVIQKQTWFRRRFM